MQQLQITQLSPEDLQELLKQLLRSELDTLKEQIVKSKAEVLYTREETAERLKIDLSTLHRWTKSGKIISHAIGTRIYYKESSIQQALVKLDPSQNIEL
jgi:excisionase family DNA binding protein